MTTNQDIVPVQLRDDNKKHNQHNAMRNPQKLVARIKYSKSELYIYEGVRESILKVLLTELGANENH